MKVAVVGTGYVGLVSGAGLAEMGNEVFCVDTDAKKIANLKNNILPIYEPGLEEVVDRNFKAKKLKFTTKLEDAVSASDVLFIAVGTPSDEDGTADLKYVLQVAKEIGQTMTDYKVVVTKSTVPVGTGLKVASVIQEELRQRSVKIDFDVVSNPEFLKEGAAVEDFLRPDRIVIGCDSNKSEKIMRELYAPFVERGHPLLVMDIASSEMTKYAANALLATKISFMNEMARVSEIVGADIEKVREGIGSDPRIGKHFIYAGVGYGGSCFPKDVKAIMNTGKNLNLPMSIMESVELVNKTQRDLFIQKIVDLYGEDLTGLSFAVWGLAFKPGTDDMREAPAITIIDSIRSRGGHCKAYDPVAKETAIEIIGTDSVEYVDNISDAIENANALVLMTDWKEFKTPDFELLTNKLIDKTIFDGRNQYNPSEIMAKGFKYFCIGRPDSKSNSI
ncbi:MAG: UDP-glucose/GDP-mannose dehydrogenase family protein [Bdellovibrionales bacterium]